MLTLERVRRQIEEVERRERERQRGAAARPPAPEWLLEGGRHQRPVFVHLGSCWDGRKRSRGITREEARRALAEGVRACPQCNPDAELRFLD